MAAPIGLPEIGTCLTGAFALKSTPAAGEDHCGHDGEGAPSPAERSCAHAHWTSGGVLSVPRSIAIVLLARRAAGTPRRLSGGETVDVIDAAVIDVATNGDQVLTGDPQDLAVLADSAGVGLTIIQVD
jgi:hypothetical protein